MTGKREAVFDILGRTVAVVLPVFAILAIEGSLWSWHGLVLGVGGSALMLAAVQAGFAANATELLALGSLVAALRGTTVGVLLLSAFDLWLGGSRLSVVSVLASAAAVLILVTLWEEASLRFRTRRRRVLIVGRSGGAPDVIEELRALKTSPFEIIGVVDDHGESGWPVGTRVLGGVDDLADLIESEHPDLVVVALGQNRPAIFGHLLDHASSGFRVVEIAQFFEHALGRVPVYNLTRAWFMSVLHLYQQPYSRTTKRAFDVVVSSVGLLVVLPLLPLVALVVRLTTGPVLLGQTRVGENGRLFTMYKFRTMSPGAERPGEAVWASEGDPRATAVGRWMRRIRLDEIPQLWNVIRGDMSIVGPRPERPEFLDELEQQVPYWSRRQLIKPGITGWAQIRRGYTADMDGSAEKLSYDFWYLRHRSLLVDIGICLHTVGMILRGGGKPERVRPRSAVARLPNASINPAAVPPTDRLTAATGHGSPASAAGAAGSTDVVVPDVSAGRATA